MTTTGQDFSYYSGTDQDIQVTIPRTASVPTAADVTAAKFILAQRGVVQLSKSLVDFTVTEDASLVYITGALADTDLTALVGAYDAEWRATIDGKEYVLAVGTHTITRSDSD